MLPSKNSTAHKNGQRRHRLGWLMVTPEERKLMAKKEEEQAKQRLAS